jgi:hypothetical protein
MRDRLKIVYFFIHPVEVKKRNLQDLQQHHQNHLYQQNQVNPANKLIRNLRFDKTSPLARFNVRPAKIK